MLPLSNFVAYTNFITGHDIYQITRDFYGPCTTGATPGSVTLVIAYSLISNDSDNLFQHISGVSRIFHFEFSFVLSPFCFLNKDCSN